MTQDNTFWSLNMKNTSSEVKVQPSSPSSEHGIGVGVAALFLLGALAGAGVMAMPKAFMLAGDFTFKFPEITFKIKYIKNLKIKIK